MDLSDTPKLPPFDWRAIYADPVVAFYEARRQDVLRAITYWWLAEQGPFTPDMYERALAVNLTDGCVLFNDRDEVAKAEAQVIRALAPYVAGRL